MDLALNNLQRFICHKAKETTPKIIIIIIIIIIFYSFCVFHISASWWFFTGVRVAASLLNLQDSSQYSGHSQ